MRTTVASDGSSQPPLTAAATRTSAPDSSRASTAGSGSPSAVPSEQRLVVDPVPHQPGSGRVLGLVASGVDQDDLAGHLVVTGWLR